VVDKHVKRCTERIFKDLSYDERIFKDLSYDERIFKDLSCDGGLRAADKMKIGSGGGGT
jgi:hypothetical protein